jgi:tetratricopeptide (TPR) repeat protein
MALHLKSEAAGDAAYDGAPYDSAMAQVMLGRALERSGDAEAALPHLEKSRERFERLKQPGMAGAALIEKADCLTDLGRYDEAAEAYQQAIGIAEELQDPRQVAVGKGQLGDVRLRQKNYSVALRLYAEARDVFERFNEPTSVATIWHQIGIVHENAGGFEAAESAYQKSLGIKIQIGIRAAQAATLGQLGNLYSKIGRREDAVRLYRQAAEIQVASGDMRSEGVTRGNIANELIKLGRYDEARREIERAVECDKPFGHVTQPWKTFHILCDLERAVGNQPAVGAARDQALAAYLSYRRDGGAPELDTAQLVAAIKQNPAAARKTLDDHEIPFRLAAEITLALESLV